MDLLAKITTGASKQDVTIKYKIRTKTNEELRQIFFTKYIPRILSLGLTIPDSTFHFDEESKLWIYQQPDWNEFKKIIKNKGPRSQARLNLRRTSYENNAWVRDALVQSLTNKEKEIREMGKNKTFYQEYEVFSKRTPTATFQHQFSLLAPNEEMALVMAQENFMRREPVTDIWIVNR